MRQVLLNLVSNALKFTQVGGVILHVENFPIERLHFRVEDTGAGVAENELYKLFEAFGQTATGKASQQGTGLGLPISRQFVQLMGGEISVQSEVGKGSVFEFTIYAPTVVNIHNEQAHTCQVIALEPNQPCYRILIVDDKWDNRQLLIQLLSPLGFELEEAENGQQSIEIFEKWHPHLIWMDISMPVLDGLEATKYIKATPKGQKTFVLALTASSHDEQQALATGFDDFLRKPFKENDIFELMQKHIGVRYIYEKQSATKSVPMEVLTETSFAALPSELVANLKEATTLNDMNMVNDVIEEIRSHNVALADALAVLADDFKYEEIGDFLNDKEEKF